MKQFSYNYERMLELLKIEQACVKRASGLDGDENPCDRDCANCPLVQETDQLLDMYEKVIRLVTREVNRVKREKRYKEDQKNWYQYLDNLEKNDPEEYDRYMRFLDAGGEGW